MAIHLLGNGPSIRYFARDEWSNSEDIFVGCNFSDPDLEPNYTTIIDVNAIRKLCKIGTPSLQIPALISKRAHKYLTDTSKVTVFDVIDVEQDRSISSNLTMNAGQHGLLYAIRNNSKERTIHIWGTDSFWGDDLVSASDAIMRPQHTTPRIKPQITRTWRKYWSKIFNEYTNHTFFIHSPVGVFVPSDVTKHQNVLMSRWDMT